MKQVTFSSGQVVTLHPRQAMKRKKPAKNFRMSARFPAPPVSVNYAGKNVYPIDGNDRYGDCEYAAACHMAQTFTGNVSTECTFDPKAIVKAYLKLSGGDNGLDTDTMMAEWKRGLVGGPHKIIDTLAVNPLDTNAMRLAHFLFGGVFFTLGIPDAWLNDPKPGDTWDAGKGVSADDSNGHAVAFTDYGPAGFVLQTWGFAPGITITPGGIAACDPEADVVFSLDWFNASGVAPNGFTYDQLASFWVQLGGGPLPPSPFVVAPPVPPVPLPPAPVPPGPAPAPTPSTLQQQLDAIFAAAIAATSSPLMKLILQLAQSYIDKLLSKGAGSAVMGGPLTDEIDSIFAIAMVAAAGRPLIMFGLTIAKSFVDTLLAGR